MQTSPLDQRSSQASNSVSARYASKISRHAFILPIRYRYAIKNDRLLKLVIQKTTSYNTGQEIHDGNDGNWRRAPNQLPQCPYILRIFTAKNCRALLVLADAKVEAGTEQTAGQHAAAFSTASAVQRESVRSAAHMGTLHCTVRCMFTVCVNRTSRDCGSQHGCCVAHGMEGQCGPLHYAKGGDKINRVF